MPARVSEFSGTLKDVGLPAIVHFLAGLKKTGCLRLADDGGWNGEIGFDVGQLTSASFGSRTGLPALDALVQVLPDASFSFEATSRASGAPTIELSAEAVQAHLTELMARIASGLESLPAVDEVPALVPQPESGAAEDALPFDRATLETLLAVDGQRTVRAIVAQRGSLEAVWELKALVEVGLVRLNPNAGEMPHEQVETAGSGPNAVEMPYEHAPTASFGPDAGETLREQPESVHFAPPAGGTPGDPAELSQPGPAEPLGDAPGDRPGPPQVEPAEASVHCSMLGFEDDPATSSARPTRLHRCFAIGAPLLLSLDQQRELCLSEYFATCPRLAMAGRDTARPAVHGFPQASSATGGGPDAASDAGGPVGALPEEPGADAPRIVRLPAAGRDNSAARRWSSDRQTESASPLSEEGSTNAVSGAADSPQPTPLRARIDRAVGAAAGSGTSAASTGAATPGTAATWAGLGTPAGVATAAGAATPAASGRSAPADSPGPVPDVPRVARRSRSASTPGLDGPAHERQTTAPARPRAAPVLLIVGVAIAVLALAVLVILFAPQLGRLVVRAAPDLSGSPVAQLATRRTPVIPSASTAHVMPVQGAHVGDAVAASDGTSASR